MSSSHIKYLYYDSTAYQYGYGIPNHIAPIGSVYVDNITATLYINKNGIADWISLLDSSYSFTGGTTTFSGGTVIGATIFTNGLTANTISATTYLGLPANYWTISGSNIINTNASGAVITYNSASNGYYYNTAFKTQFINGGVLTDGFTIQNGGNAFGQYIYGVWFNVVAGGGLQDNTGTVKFYTPDGNYWLSNKPIYGTIISANTIQTPSFTVNSTGITQSNGFTILSNLSTLNAVNDAAAAALGVPLYGLYRNGNVVQIRIV